MSPTVRPVVAREGEVVEIRWFLEDGTVHYERVTVPPKATRDVRQESSCLPTAP